jgi:murein DD-endopeptidase MepM/ murein hydrolase activator NlpD
MSFLQPKLKQEVTKNTIEISKILGLTIGILIASNNFLADSGSQQAFNVSPIPTLNNISIQKGILKTPEKPKLKYSVDGKVMHPIQDIKTENNGEYPEDTGIDIKKPIGTPVVAASSGTIVYSERGHTNWGTVDNIDIDTPNSVLIELDNPIEYKGKLYKYQWYTHLSTLNKEVSDSSLRVHINQGDSIGKVGLGNKVPHLHFGMLTDPEQDDGQFMESHQAAEYLGINKHSILADKSSKQTDIDPHTLLKEYMNKFQQLSRTLLTDKTNSTTPKQPQQPH